MWHWLISLILAALAAISHGHTFAVDFADWPDGPPAAVFTLYDNSADVSYTPAANAGLQVVDGALQTMATGPGLAAGYAQVDLGAPVRVIGAEFSFTAGNPGGAIALPLWEQPFNETRNVDQNLSRVPPSPAHVVVSRANWAYQLYDGSRIVTLADGVFDPPLPAGQSLTLEVRLDEETGAVALPDGRIVTVSDPRIAQAAHYATFEAFVMDAATMSRPLMTRVWADTA